MWIKGAALQPPLSGPIPGSSRAGPWAQQNFPATENNWALPITLPELGREEEEPCQGCPVQRDVVQHSLPEMKSTGPQRVQDVAEKQLRVLQPQQLLPSCWFWALNITGMLTSQITVASKSKPYIFWVDSVQYLYEDLKMGPSGKQLFLSGMS